MPPRPITLQDVLLSLVQDSASNPDQASNELTNVLVQPRLPDAVGAKDTSAGALYGSGLGSPPGYSPFTVFGEMRFGETAFPSKVIPIAMDYRSGVLGNNPVGYWRFSEVGGTSTADWSSPNYLNSMSLNGGYTLGQTGALLSDGDPSIKLNGTSGYGDAGDNASLRLTHTGSLVAWVNPSSYPAAYAVVAGKGNWNSGRDFYGIYYQNGGSVLVFELDSSAAQRTVSVANTLTPLNTWSQVAMTWDGSTIRCYINGSQVTTGVQLAADPSTSGKNFQVGANTTNTNNWFNGYLDEIAVYNVALSAAQIAADYALGRISSMNPPEKMGAKVTSTLTGQAAALTFGDAVLGRIQLNVFG